MLSFIFSSLSLWFCLQSFQFIFVACNQQRITYSLTRSFASKTHSHTNLSCSPFPFWCSFILILLLLLELNFHSLFRSRLSLSLSVSINLWVFVRKVHNAELKNCSPQKRLNFYALIQREKKSVMVKNPEVCLFDFLVRVIWASTPLKKTRAAKAKSPSNWISEWKHIHSILIQSWIFSI